MNVKKRAKKYKRQITNYYGEVKLPLELDFIRAVGDLFIFQVEFVPGTTEDKIRASLKDVQQTLDLELFQLHREGRDLFIVVSECNTYDNRLLRILASPVYPEYIKDMQVPYPIGYNIMRQPVVVDLVTYIHWLMGGSSASGKTIGVTCLITGVVYSCSPEDVNLIVFDGASNLMQFDGLPHLSCPIIQNSHAGFWAVKEGYKEMEERIEMKSKDIEAFNRQPHLIYVIDEFVSFISGIGDRTMAELLPYYLSQLLRRGRHAKIHLVMAAQDPVMKYMKCDIGNATARLAFTCAKPHYSVTILGEGGAEKLSGNGEMYFKSPKHTGLQYIKGAFISPDEINAVCDHIRAKYNEAKWDDSYKFNVDLSAFQYTTLIDEPLATVAATMQDADDKLLAEILMWTFGRRTVSANAIHQAFVCGQRKAGRFLEVLQKFGVVDEAKEKNPRNVLPTCFECLCVEAVNFLNRYEHTYEDICNAFNADLNQSEISGNEHDTDDYTEPTSITI